MNALGGTGWTAKVEICEIWFNARHRDRDRCDPRGRTSIRGGARRAM